MLDMPLILAQAVPSGPLDQLYTALKEYGLVGIALGVMIWMWWRRDDALQKCKDKRLEEALKLSEVIKNQTLALQVSNQANEQRNRALEASAKATEKSVVIVEQLVKEIESLHLECKRLKEG